MNTSNPNERPIKFDGKSVTIKCATCGTEFNPGNRPTGSVFCSHSCKESFDYTKLPILKTKTIN